MATISTAGGTLTWNAVALTAVAKSLNPIGATVRNETDTTTMGSAAAESRPGLPDWGTCEVDVVYDPDNVGIVACLAGLAAGTVANLIYTAPSGTLNVYTGSAWVKEVSMTSDLSSDSVQMGKITFRFTGPVTVA
jgi:hypothetical protein